MDGLKEAIQKLHIWRNNPIEVPFSEQIIFENIVEIEKKVSVLANNRVGNEINSKEIKTLVKKIKKDDISLRRSEITKLPFIIYDEDINDEIDTDKVINLINFESERSVQRLIVVYFMNYDESKKTIKIKNRISKYFENLSVKHKFHLSMLKQINECNDILFSSSCLDLTAKLLIVKKGFYNCLRSIGIIESMDNSNYLHFVIRRLYSKHYGKLLDEINILEELFSKGEQYLALFPSIADSLIPYVDKEKNISDKEYSKKICLDVFYKTLGDPRFGKRQRKWDSISIESRNIFLKWIAEDDLELFFKIIERTAVDRMWRYRHKFWKTYLPYITNTWVFLGKDAQRIAKQLGDKRDSFGKLKGGTTNQSVFAFQIGEYIFLEWSHNGALKVWSIHDHPNLFGETIIERSDIMYSNYIYEWRHSSPSTGNWQFKVSRWINAYCKICIGYDEWGL